MLPAGSDTFVDVEGPLLHFCPEYREGGAAGAAEAGAEPWTLVGMSFPEAVVFTAEKRYIQTCLLPSFPSRTVSFRLDGEQIDVDQQACARPCKVWPIRSLSPGGGAPSRRLRCD